MWGEGCGGKGFRGGVSVRGVGGGVSVRGMGGGVWGQGCGLRGVDEGCGGGGRGVGQGPPGADSLRRPRVVLPELEPDFDGRLPVVPSFHRREPVAGRVERDAVHLRHNLDLVDVRTLNVVLTDDVQLQGTTNDGVFNCHPNHS